MMCLFLQDRAADLLSQNPLLAQELLADTQNCRLNQLPDKFDESEIFTLATHTL